MLGKIEEEVKGICPLLQNRFHNEKNPVKDKGSEKYLNWQLENSKYQNGNGLYQPAEHFEKCFEIAGGQFKLKGKSTYRQAIKGGIFITPQEIPHRKSIKVSPFLHAVVIQRARVMASRCMIENWTLGFTIEVVDDRINFETLKEICQYAGAYIGIGDWRPKFGRFKIVKFEEK